MPPLMLLICNNHISFINTTSFIVAKIDDYVKLNKTVCRNRKLFFVVAYDTSSFDKSGDTIIATLRLSSAPRMRLNPDYSADAPVYEVPEKEKPKYLCNTELGMYVERLGDVVTYDGPDAPDDRNQSRCRLIFLVTVGPHGDQVWIDILQNRRFRSLVYGNLLLISYYAEHFARDVDDKYNMHRILAHEIPHPNYAPTR
ncbi:predicted protein [Pyrenophora tritici-repentis Pt-1C-BFP]|uniref:Uncharacterized protein n=1 Tax=Pyrenophora tritici-repentis (strain Pt-1C-BFP) TaxID=426418 RepID=B2WHR7_PYRTR|nr:uncharacterized protein PTRG_09526 [Pyrenophora tritici-repentis Pt-1C-BFP]EDU42577.1 predicted protein [Pyrenophora tritici-repentis Pt-1C-BFP]